MTTERAEAGTTEDLVRFFSATAAHDTYYLHPVGGFLSEKIWEGAEWSLPKRITKINANHPAAAYLAGNVKRVIFTINESGKLENYIYDDEDEEWSKGKLGSANVATLPNSYLTAIWEGGQPHIYYQDPEGKIQQLYSADGETWESGGGLTEEAKPVAGTALASLAISPNKVAVFYQHEDGTLHYQLKDYETLKWTDHKLEKYKIKGTAAKIIVSTSSDEGSDSGFDVGYLNKEGGIYSITPESETSVGTLDTNGVFKSATSAENFRRDVLNALVANQGGAAQWGRRRGGGGYMEIQFANPRGNQGGHGQWAAGGKCCW